MTDEIRQTDRTIAEATVLRTQLEALPGHRAAMARGQLAAAIDTLRQVRAFLEKGESGVWVKS